MIIVYEQIFYFTSLSIGQYKFVWQVKDVLADKPILRVKTIIIIIILYTTYNLETTDNWSSKQLMATCIRIAGGLQEQKYRTIHPCNNLPVLTESWPVIFQ